MGGSDTQTSFFNALKMEIGHSETKITAEVREAFWLAGAGQLMAFLLFLKPLDRHKTDPDLPRLNSNHHRVAYTHLQPLFHWLIADHISAN